MTIENENKAVITRLVTQIFNAKDLSVLDDLLAPGYQDHNSAEVYDPAATPVDADGFRAALRMFFDAFPNFQMTVDHLVAEGDKVVCFWTSTGVHRGEFLGISATGKRVTFSGVAVDRLIGGRIIESWGILDIWGVALQIGAIPDPDHES